jgi:methylthioribulose-1-phosphate dehydratase
MSGITSPFLTAPEAAPQLAAIARGFYERGWLPGTSGNLSVRLADSERGEPRMLITVSGRDKGELTEADFIQLGPMATPIESTPNKPSAEALLHEVVYAQFPEARAVFHIHSVTATLLSQQLPPEATELRIQGLEMLKGLSGHTTHEAEVAIPVFPNHQDMVVLSRQVAQRGLSANCPGFLLKGHGLYAWGNSLFEAKRHVETFEFLFQVAFQSRLLGVVS